MRLAFDRGTLVFHEVGPASPVDGLQGVRWDPRAGVWRAPAYRYEELRLQLANRGRDFVDEVAPQLASGGARAPSAPRAAESLRPYQAAALDAWELSGRRGVVVLPTGSGKTHVGLAAMGRARSVLCLVPTRVLLGQWYTALCMAGFAPVGRLGDGEQVLERITVSTFESAWRRAPRLGNQFELIVVDEVHHFGVGVRDEVLELSVAPARLGLTATPVQGNAADRLRDLVGPPVYELAIADLRGEYLADFELLTITLDLTVDERRGYEEHIGRFRDWQARYARLPAGTSWADLARLAGATDEGRRALRSLHEARRAVAFPLAKQRALGSLLARHRGARVLVFTTDNDTAYAVSRENLVMCITCEIRRAERDAALTRFRTGDLRALVSARVLNEGIDVPDADVAIVVGGNGGAREHVQRVGRVLRPGPGKRALVYELVVRGTIEARKARERRRALAPA